MIRIEREAADAVDFRRLNGFFQSHRRIEVMTDTDPVFDLL